MFISRPIVFLTLNAYVWTEPAELPLPGSQCHVGTPPRCVEVSWSRSRRLTPGRTVSLTAWLHAGFCVWTWLAGWQTVGCHRRHWSAGSCTGTAATVSLLIPWSHGSRRPVTTTVTEIHHAPH